MPDVPVVPVSTSWGGFAHLSAAKASRYRQILAVFADARRNYTVHLRPQDVARDLGVPADEAVTLELDQLVEWGNLRPAPDTTRVTSVEDFNRRRHLYSLTRTGEAVEAGLGTYARVLGRRAELQTVALEDIRTSLGVLVGLAEADEVDPARAAATLRELDSVFTSLADNAAAFMSSLTRSIDTAADGEEGFVAYKDGLIDYLQRFIGDLVVASAEITSQVDTIEHLGIERVLAAAVGRHAVDALPQDGSEADHRQRLFDTWTGLRRWFVGTHDVPSQATLLRSRARAAIPDLLETVQTLHERRAGRSDRMADYVTLARWFADAPDDDARHRLWRAAFGLHPSRHLGIDGETQDARADHDVPATTPWADAPPIHVSARLRKTTRYTRTGPSRIHDRTEARRALARQLAEEQTELAAARQRLATGQELRLSEFGVAGDGGGVGETVDAETLEVLLGLLGEALASSGQPGQPVDTISSDGTLRLRLRPTKDGRVARIRSPHGTLVGHDHILQITSLTGTNDE